MNMNQITLAAALALMGGIAQASVIDITPDPMTAGSSYFHYEVHNVAGTFEDTYNFSIDTGASSLLDTLWVSFTLPGSAIGGGFSSKIDGLNVQLWKDMSTDELLFTGLTSSYALADGDYYFKVTGDVTGSQYGDYTLAFGTKASNVPEPQTLALLGLGLIGMMRLRRR